MDNPPKPKSAAKGSASTPDDKSAGGNGQDHKDTEVDASAGVPSLFVASVSLANKDGIISKLRRRALFLKSTAIFILFLIMVLLAGGGYVIYEADRFVTADLTGLSVEPISEPLNAIKPTIDDINKQIVIAREQLEQGRSLSEIAPPLSALSNANDLRRATVDKAKMEAIRSSIVRSLEATSTREVELLATIGSMKRNLEALNLNIAQAAEQRGSLGILLETMRPALARLPEASGERIDIQRNIDRATAEIKSQDSNLATLEISKQSIAGDLEPLNAALADVQGKLASLRDERDQIDIELARLDQEIATETEEEAEFKAARDRESALQQQRVEELRKLNEAAQSVVLLAGASIESLKGLVGQTEALEGKFGEKLDERVTNKTISTLTARITIVFILIFLTQILVNLYRYNMRLAFFYDGRADALELYSSGSQNLIECLFDALSPERLDFGKTPPSPAQHAVELAKALVDREKKSLGK